MRAVNGRPPRDNLVRAIKPGIEVRQVAEGDGMPTLFGHFAVFNVWTEVDSIFEGRFLEQIRPGAFRKTFREQREQIKVLFQHGCDPFIGDKPLGQLTDLREDETGAYYEAPLFDASYVRDLIPGLEAGAYGASFRFSVMKEEFVEDPGASDHNPKGLPERTIQEARVYEGGPVTFGQYPEATAGLRSVSLTDEMIVRGLYRDPARMRAIMGADPEGLRELHELLDLGYDLSSIVTAIRERDFAHLDSGSPQTQHRAEEIHSISRADGREEQETEALPDGADAGHSVRDGSREPLYIGREKEAPSWAL